VRARFFLCRASDVEDRYAGCAVRVVLLTLSFFLVAASVSAQDATTATASVAEPEAGAATTRVAPPAGDANVSDDEVIRWAAREVGRHDRLSLGRYPPVPPDEYLGHSAPSIALPGESNGQIGARLFAELGGGTLGLLLGGGAGSLLVWAVLEERVAADWTAVAIGAGTVLGALGLTAGVTVAADLTGGRGNFGYAFLGQVVGAVAALPIVVFGQANDALALSLVAVGILPLAGAILGYEIGHADHPLSGPALAYLTPIDGGAVAGVAGPLP